MAGTALDYTLKDIDGQDVNLKERYLGQVVMIVNVASKCGFTGQYADLEQLYLKYKDRGFVILGFPANNFLGQEPGANLDIKQFCTLKYNVTFPMFAKLSVKGKDIAPLYDFLTRQDSAPEKAGNISWNFNKFLLDRQGNVAFRFGTRMNPAKPEVAKAIEDLLAKPAPVAAPAVSLPPAGK